MNKKDILALEQTYMKVFNEIYLPDENNQDLYVAHVGHFNSDILTKESMIALLNKKNFPNVEVGLRVQEGELYCDIIKDGKGTVVNLKPRD